MAIPLWLREKLFLKDLLTKELKKLDGPSGWNGQLLFSEHHLSHAASAFFPSPFDEAVVLTMDGVGEWATTSAAIGKGNNLEVQKEIHFPAFAGPAVFGLHLLHRVQGQLRGIQGHGARAVWRAEVREPDPRAPDRREGRRLVQARSVVLRLLHRPDHDEREVRRSVRRSAAQAGRTADAAAHGPGGLDPGGDRRSRAALDARAVAGKPACGICAWPAALRSIAWRTARFCATANSSRSISSPPQAMQAVRWVRRWSATTCSWVRTRHVNGDAMRGAYLGPAFSQEDIEARLKSCGARFEVLDDRRSDRYLRGRSGAGQGARLVPGAHGVWASRAWAIARFSAIHARRPCKRCSISRSSIASPSGRLRPRCCASVSATGSSSMATARICCWWPTW